MLRDEKNSALYMRLNERIEAFCSLGEQLEEFLIGKESVFSLKMNSAIARAGAVNGWFTSENILKSLKSIADMLDRAKIQQWIKKYEEDIIDKAQKSVAVIMAGNIPVVGFHDFLCVLISGNKIIARLSSSDPFLLPVIAEEMISLYSGFSDKIEFVERINSAEAVIATGSNNSARYFEYYFGKHPHIIRKNRNSVAVLTGEENAGELRGLGIDIFSYYGLGCRNVSKLYVPEEYDFQKFWNAIFPFEEIIRHNKYANNFDYNRAILLLEQKPFLTNNFLILKEDKELATPVAVLNYERADISFVQEEIGKLKDQIQCVVSSAKEFPDRILFGKTQQPQLWDYADNIDTMEFLINLK
jgi:hypothetical protein